MKLLDRWNLMGAGLTASCAEVPATDGTSRLSELASVASTAAGSSRFQLPAVYSTDGEPGQGNSVVHLMALE
jgi:hypothetical protein